MASVNRKSLIPYMAAYRRYLDAQKRGVSVRPLSNVQEDYKRGIAVKAAKALASESWTADETGKGTISGRVIKAVQGNVNLIGRFQVSAFSDKVKEDYSVSEKLLFDLYHEHKDQECFERICNLFGRKYDLVAYLYFILDPEKYLPLRPSIFDSIFKKLGIHFQTTASCSWDNYQDFLGIVAYVRDVMKEYYQVEDVDLLDAHSFLWTINLKEFNVASEDLDSVEHFAREIMTEYDSGVYHRDYGKGTIIKLTNEKVYVDFNGKNRIFPYPDAFLKEYIKPLYQIQMEKQFFSMPQENYTRRAQIPIRRSRFDYLISQYAPKKNCKWIMFQHPGHFLVYDMESKCCAFDGTVIVFENAEDHASEEEPIVAVISEITFNEDRAQFPEGIDDGFGVFMNLILEKL